MLLYSQGIVTLKRIGLVDQENKPTERAFKWRDDDQYREACEEIRREVYPQELLDAFSASDINRPAVERWFRNNARVGENAAGKLTTFYLLLVNAGPNQQNKNASSGQGSKQAQKNRSNPKEKATPAPQDNNSTGSLATPQEKPARQDKVNDGPSLHIDVQVHISSDASAEQIDSIFASMAKHLYKTNET